MKIFNTTGPVRAADHYTLDPLSRWNTAEIDFLITQKKYFILHAPRQSGKTSCMLALQEKLNREGQYHCLYVNVEPAQVARADVKKGLHAIIDLIVKRADNLFKDPKIKALGLQVIKENSEHTWLSMFFNQWCASLGKPLVLLIDEIDSLVDDTLLSVLRQLREGYDTRPQYFPQSVILCGVRDVRDYRIHSTSLGSNIKGGSAFNIKAESLTLGNFTLEQIQKLYLQHTQVTGQKFALEIWKPLWNYTRGQPWLVNALAYELCFKMPETRNPSTTINLTYLNMAKERLIQRRDTHLDQLIHKLQEERVRRIIEPLIVGGDDASNEIIEDDAQYSIDLGLVRKEKGTLQISNQIYQEIIPRALVYERQFKINQDQAWYINSKTQKLDMVKLLKAFAQFFKENFEHWAKNDQYSEAAPQLILQAFMQRVINGGGRITREYGMGRKRLDLFIEWPLIEDAFIKQGPVQKIIIELKMLYPKKTLKATETIALKQIGEYANYLETSAEKHIIICDPNPKKSWKQKIKHKKMVYKKETIHIWGI